MLRFEHLENKKNCPCPIWREFNRFSFAILGLFGITLEKSIGKLKRRYGINIVSTAYTACNRNTMRVMIIRAMLLQHKRKSVLQIKINNLKTYNKTRNVYLVLKRQSGRYEKICVGDFFFIRFYPP